MRMEFIDTVIEACNNSGLPFFVIEDDLKQILQNVSEAALKQYQMEKAKYEELIKKEEKDKEKTTE